MSTARLIPHLVCRNARDALAFYRRALDAEVLMQLDAPDGSLMHACLRVNGAELFLADECPATGAMAPTALGGSPVSLHLSVPDCDAVFAAAVAAGCTPQMPPQEMFWGDRFGVFVDPFGHVWSVATPVRQLDEAELRDAAARAFAQATAAAPAA
jgi:PhnB protein